MKYLKNAILCASLLALGATQLIYSMDESARSADSTEEIAETPIEEGGITAAILEALREASPKDWCAIFPGGKVCNPYFKKLACDGDISGDYQRSFEITTPQIYNNIYPTKGRIDLRLDGSLKKRSIEWFAATFWIKGKKAIETYKKNLFRYSDKHTSCRMDEWVDHSGIDMAWLLCKTSGLTYDQFAEAMNK